MGRVHTTRAPLLGCITAALLRELFHSADLLHRRGGSAEAAGCSGQYLHAGAEAGQSGRA